MQPIPDHAPLCAEPDRNPRPPRTPFPAFACDTHAHVFGPPDLFPYAEKRRYTPPAAPIEHYRNVQRITGLSRAEMVHDKKKLYELGGVFKGLVHKWNPEK